jgi:hypothetical protein
MICPGRPFWWANMYYGQTIEGLEGFYEISRRNFLTPRSNSQAVARIQSNLSDCGRVGSKAMQSVRKDLIGDTLPGEVEFFERVQKLLDAVQSGNVEAAALMVRSVRKHFEADTILSHTLNARCREEYCSEAGKNEIIKSLEADLRRQVGDGTFSFAEADEKLKTAKQEVESDAFQLFYKNGGEERVAAVIWQELASSPERVGLLAEADDFEQQAKLLLA